MCKDCVFTGPAFPTSSTPVLDRSVPLKSLGGSVTSPYWPEHSKRAGFTLLELLISMTLMGLLTFAIHYGFRLGLSAYEKGEQHLQLAHQRQTVLNLISRQLGSLAAYYSIQRLEEQPVDVLVFQGTESGMRFVTTCSSQGLHADGMLLVEYFLAPSRADSGTALVANEAPLPEDKALTGSVLTGLTKGPDDIVLAEFAEFKPDSKSIYLFEGLSEARFRYLQHPSLEPATPGFQPLGKKRAGLPAGVEIQLRFREGSFGKDMSIVIPFHGANS